MMFEKTPTFENELRDGPGLGSRLHRLLPMIALGLGVVILAVGLHGAGAAFVGVAAAHLGLAAVLFGVRWFGTRGER